MNPENPISSIDAVKHRSFRLTPFRVRSIPAFRALLRTEIPADFRSFVLAFLAGAVLSFPVGLVLALTVRPFEPPKWVEPIYVGLVLGALIVLPFWSHFALKREPLLRRLGLGAFQAAIFYFVVYGLFIPPL